MGIIRIFGKLAALVVLGVGTILKLIGDFAVGVSGPWLRIIAMFLFVIAIVCRIFSVADWGAERRADRGQLHRLYASHNRRLADRLRGKRQSQAVAVHSEIIGRYGHCFDIGTKTTLK